ncbi:hypothetical protein DLAC_04620 [Tieghemostelium lacteum]|uniref:SH3 domain-containing protein n=1 Tax=Tieghemostelium lacteum TaxID=361077 RepID=A0A151ZJZ3_TIELA|nr:hypothetical protein DLAC_04620 [Tieghemostelium lacteum]|eukprot:KYQ94321.1 hypothetical protein DLAC_04620 [Tieghemostelium lacteum]
MDPLDELAKASRSVRVSIYNSTSKKLVLKAHPSTSGNWKVLPADTILPLSTVECGTDGNMLHGTEAGSIYVMEGREQEGQFEFFWNNPGFGKKGYRRVAPPGYDIEMKVTESNNCILNFTVKEVGATMKDVDEIEREIKDITVMMNEIENVIKGTTKMLQVYQSQNDQKQVKLVENTIRDKTKHLEDLRLRRDAQRQEIDRIKKIESDPKEMELILSRIRENIESSIKARKGMEHMRELYEKQKDTKSLEGLDKQIEMKKNETELLRKKEQKVIQKVIELKKALGIGSTIAAVQKKRVIANYDYTKNSEDELSMKTGDIIEIVQDDNPDWYGGVLNGQMGYFPRSFVEPYTVQDAQAQTPSQSTDGQDSEQTEDYSHLYPKARVVYAHDASDDTQINLTVGDIVTVYSWEDDYWWDGSVNGGKAGYFPNQCVDWIEPEATTQDQDYSNYSYYESGGVSEGDQSSQTTTPTTPTPQPTTPTPQPTSTTLTSKTSVANTSSSNLNVNKNTITPNNQTNSGSVSPVTSRNTFTAPVLNKTVNQTQGGTISASTANNAVEPPKPPQKRELPQAPKITTPNPTTPNPTPQPVVVAQPIPQPVVVAQPTYTTPKSETPTPPSTPTTATPSMNTNNNSSTAGFEKLLQPILTDLTKKLVESHQKETAALNQKNCCFGKRIKRIKR